MLPCGNESCLIWSAHCNQSITLLFRLSNIRRNLERVSDFRLAFEGCLELDYHCSHRSRCSNHAWRLLLLVLVDHRADCLWNHVHFCADPVDPLSLWLFPATKSLCLLISQIVSLHSHLHRNNKTSIHTIPTFQRNTVGTSNMGIPFFSKWVKYPFIIWRHYVKMTNKGFC